MNIERWSSVRWLFAHLVGGFFIIFTSLFTFSLWTLGLLSNQTPLCLPLMHTYIWFFFTAFLFLHTDFSIETMVEDYVHTPQVRMVVLWALRVILGVTALGTCFKILSIASTS